MGLLTFGINLTLDGCVDHREGIADDETHAHFTRLMDRSGAMLWGRVTYELMENFWPAVARGERDAPPALKAWAVTLETKPKYVASTTRKEFPWTNTHHLGSDLRLGIEQLKASTPAGVLLGSGQLATALDRLDLIDEYKFLLHPRIVAHLIAPGLELGGPLHIALADGQKGNQAPVQFVDGGPKLGHIGAGAGRHEAPLEPRAVLFFGGSVILHRSTVSHGGCPQQAFYI